MNSAHSFSPGLSGHRLFLLRFCYASLCLALCMVLPFLTGQIPTIGKLLCPMHLPVLLCGSLCGAPFGLAVGLAAPLLRFALFGAPELIPRGIAMMAELGAYGLVSGLLRGFWQKKKSFIYISLPIAMLCGRIAGGIAKIILLFCGRISSYGISAFLTGYFIETLPGVALQLAVIPPVVRAVSRMESKAG